jgi:signal transduction histidine kinase
LGLGTKLNVAFFTVILVVVLSFSGYQVVVDYTGSREAARKAIQPAISKVMSEIDRIQKSNMELANQLNNDPGMRDAFAARNRDAVANEIRQFSDKVGLPGYVTILDDKGRVFYSSDTPAKFGYAPKEQSGEFQYVLKHNSWFGTAAPSAAGTLSISTMVPIISGKSVSGIIAVNQPFNSEFLTGLQKKLEITDNLRDIGMVLFSMRDGRVVAATPELSQRDGGYISKLNREGQRAISATGTETGGRLWKPLKLEGADANTVGIVLVSAPIGDSIPKMALILGQAGICAIFGLILAVMFSAGIAGRHNKSLKFLTQRAKDLAAQKTNIPSLEGLGGEWIELAEVIDHAVQTPRSSVRSLQSQMQRHQDELNEKNKTIETQQGQVEAVNRQLMSQSRQLSEVSKQINHANSQAIILQQKLAAVLQISTEGFLILDPYGNVLSANPVFLNWTGLSEGEVGGRYCFELVKRPGEGRNGDSPSSAFSRHGGNPGDLIAEFYPEGVVFHKAQDKNVEVISHLHPVCADDNNIQGYIMVLRDKSIHSEVGRLRSDILYMLQDSIRVPLVTAEQKWAAVMKGAPQNTPVSSALSDLHSQYQNLLGVVDSLLMIYGGVVPTVPSNREQISITRMIGDCLEAVSQQARSHQIMLDYKTVTGLPTTAVSKDIVRDVIVQLLEKMISVTAPGGRVRVESNVKNNEIRISIFSSGPALPTEEIEDMFVGFVQGKHAEDTYGSRLSLYLARNNVERIGGHVWAESDRGTYIYFTLPVVS